MNDQKGLCFLSGRKLTGRWNLHHRLHSTKYRRDEYLKKVFDEVLLEVQLNNL